MIQFIKMQGLGNDFIIIDGREQSLPQLKTQQIQAMAKRRTGVGCDQVILLSPSTKADIFMTIYNADGSVAGACGNGTRCVVSYLNQPQCTIETTAGMLRGWMQPDQAVKVDMGEVLVDLAPVDLGIEGLPEAILIDVGNPHAVFFVDDVARVDVGGVGPHVEKHFHFPEGTNVEFAQILTPQKIRMRVWERGVGITPACGSGACAVGVAALAFKNLPRESIEIELDGGKLLISWESNGHVLQTGPAVTCFRGEFPLD